MIEFAPFKVLYVEDEEDDILFMKRAVKAVSPRIQLEIARDGDEAIQRLSCAPEPPDRILLDLKMPRRSGLEVLAWIRSHPQFSKLPVSILTSSSEQSDLARVQALGIEQYIVKPVNYQGLMEIVRSMCTRWGVAG